MSPRRPFADLPEASALRLAQSLRAQAPAPRAFAQPIRARMAFLLFLGFVLPIAAAPRFMGASQSGITPRSPEMQMKSMAAVALASGVVSSSMAADAVQWRVQDGGNGHWYQVVVTAPINWTEARTASEERGGYLVTPTSPAENAFVVSIGGRAANPKGWVDDNYGNSGGPWLGGYQPVGAPSEQPWAWVSGEPWEWTAWAPGEPNNGFGPGQLVTSMLGYAGSPVYRGWADATLNDFPFYPLKTSYIIEWSADCNNDGIVDYGQCRDGSLPDYNGNNIPDCCEQGTTCVVGSYPIEWRLEDGGNGHWFGTTSQTGTWDEMRALAVARGGDLASLASLAENEFANRTRRSEDAPVGGGPWIGARKLTGQVWQWMDGTNWGFVNWAQGEPCCGDAGLYVHLYPNGQWNDHNQYQYACRALIEWSADCNADGIVDYGQILRGELADTNANGVPDTCESTLLVPSQYPTIQAAIDAVPANSQRTVQVAAGTYHESLSLNGKNVLIRGAANNATILDGTGLPASIATFAGGEPATAGLENLVFRSGIVGSLIYKGALFKVGGAVYGRDSSAFIRNCRFENNRSDYGGAVYLIYSSLLVEGCVFTGNTGVSQGGGMMAFGSTGAIRNCVFTANQCGIAGSGGGSAFKAAEALFTGETVLLDGCTITGNTAGVDGSAVEYHEDVGLHLGKMRLVNCTITGNRSGTITPVGAGGLTVTGTMQSCIIDAGTTICDNLPREVQGPYLISGAPTICDCMADLSGDGVVNGGDLGLLLSAWGATLPTGAGDVNHDGVVNGADMALLLGSWGPCN